MSECTGLILRWTIVNYVRPFTNIFMRQTIDGYASFRENFKIYEYTYARCAHHVCTVCTCVHTSRSGCESQVFALIV